MHIMELVAQLNVALFLLILAGVSCASVLLFKRLSFGACDPLWIMVMSLVFNLTLALYVFFTGNGIKAGDVVYIFVSFLCFVLGAHSVRPLAGKVRRRPSGVCADRADRSSARNGRSFIRIFVWVSTAIIMVAFAVRAYFLGIPILAADPEYLKVMMNKGGFGVVTRILEPLIYCNLFLLFYAKGSGRWRPRFGSLYFAVPVLVLLASGSKGSLVTIYFAYFFASSYLALKEGRRGRLPLKRVFLFGGAVLAYAGLVLLLRGMGTGEENPLQFAMSTFLLRFIAYGDGLFYFFSNDLGRYIAGTPFQYLWDYLVVPVGGMFRLVEYRETLGLQISRIMFGMEDFGPNPTMFVEGVVYFGHLGGAAYCFLLGTLFSFLRFTAVGLKVGGDLPRLLLFGVGNLIALTITSDMLLFMASALNNLLVLVPMFIACVVIAAAATRRKRPVLEAEPGDGVCPT